MAEKQYDAKEFLHHDKQMRINATMTTEMLYSSSKISPIVPIAMNCVTRGILVPATKFMLAIIYSRSYISDIIIRHQHVSESKKFKKHL